MNDNKGYVSHTVDMGSVNISEEVIATISYAAINEVDGIASVNGKIGGKGVRVVNDEAGLKINVSVMVKYGAVIPDVAKRVQNSVISAIENMTGLKVAAVNVQISGVNFSKTVK